MFNGDIKQTSPLRNYLAYQLEIDEAVSKVLASGDYVLGKEVSNLELEFAEFIGSEYSIGVSNGTDGITMCLSALGIQNGDEVITTSHTATATIAGIIAVGAKPVLVDIDRKSFNFEPELILQAITPKTKAIIAVHLYGNPCDLNALMEICKSKGLFLVEDASQAHGATYQGAKVGTFGHMAVFSCYPTKNLGALGDAGLVTTNNFEFFEALLLKRQYGWKQRNFAIDKGGNFRLDELQASVLRVKLRHLPQMNNSRQETAQRYVEGLADLDIDLPYSATHVQHVYHQFVISVDRRDEVKEFLEINGVLTNIHYPFPVHLQPGYRGLVKVHGKLGNTISESKRILSLPMFPEISESEVARVIDCLRQFFSK